MNTGLGKSTVIAIWFPPLTQIFVCAYTEQPMSGVLFSLSNFEKKSR